METLHPFFVGVERLVRAVPVMGTTEEKRTEARPSRRR